MRIKRYKTLGIDAPKHKPENKLEYFLSKYRDAYRTLLYRKPHEPLSNEWLFWLFSNEYKTSGRRLNF